ncbi:gas vesicle protein [Streptosporangium sp. NBC_01639]|uniref:gas vesicle protein GvpO n=1 Tax=Streptosporangium sp. NBC_01639 TaxID=2975948 RepID=UPI00387019CF|nr:gas vesicle protein [Streptosporangium sp. NBC_01639]
MPVKRVTRDERATETDAPDDLYDEENETYEDEDDFDEDEDSDEDEDEDAEDADAEEDVPARGRRSRALSAVTAGKAGLRHISDLTSKEVEGVTFVRPAEDGWQVGVEVVEDRRIPSSGDILALYEVEMDQEGNLLSYRRTRRYKRGSGDNS